ncbi:MAG: hypothetical protein ACRYG5_11545 [Janthinobacterium lividum]
MSGPIRSLAPQMERHRQPWCLAVPLQRCIVHTATLSVLAL